LNIDLSEEVTKPLPNSSFYTLGLHPWFIKNKEIIDDYKIILNKHLRNDINNSKLIGIGECGLDRLKGPDLSLQIKILEQILILAKQHNLPITLHCVRSYPELIKLTKPYFQHINIAIHGFNGSEKEAEALLKHGVKLSFGISLLKSKKLQNYVKNLQIKDIFLETDDSLIDINEIYCLVSKIKQLHISELTKQIQKNIFNFFALS
jgi:TatD DNase family protein